MPFLLFQLCTPDYQTLVLSLLDPFTTATSLSLVLPNTPPALLTSMSTVEGARVKTEARRTRDLEHVGNGPGARLITRHDVAL
ncbi:hypothetical protein CLCR_09356 [Cladophialophora carrionii]|uniref:Uncharacterized protein n=1 Tax=Cladophialophora carrionii TaxID=86049 RepID=A0A1C1CT50_9EURO|nr:hypothetical protein CLCR_09356 [Cladophialophora carrionii]